MTSKQPLTREYFENLKPPKDPLTAEGIDDLTTDEQLSALKARVAPRFQKTDHARVNEISSMSQHYPRHIGQYIKEARESLGMREGVVVGIDARERYEVEPLLVETISEIDGDILSEDNYAEWLREQVQYICNKCGLSFDVWYDYIVTYIASNEAPINAPLYTIEPFVADAIDDEWIYLRVRRSDIKLRDFRNLYRSIKAFLTPPDRAPTTFSKKHLMRLDRRAGMSINSIAKLFYPKEYIANPYDAKDLVQKMLKNRKR